MDLNAWIGAHNRAFEYFGGSTQIVVPDNLKTSVTRHTLKELVLNPTYREMCDHYGTLCMPARVRAPRDYPQTQIILKKATDCSSYREGSVAFEDNNLVQSTKF